ADARYESGPFALRAAVANISVSDAQAINAAYGQSVGSRIAGGYLEAAYNLLRLLAPASSQKVNAFVRHERYDTQASVPAGVTRDRSLARRVTTLGVTYKPTWNTAFKGDYQLVRNAAGAGEVAYGPWRRQFRGKSAGDSLRVGKEIRSISGATISVHAVTLGVRRMLAQLTAWHQSGAIR